MHAVEIFRTARPGDHNEIPTLSVSGGNSSRNEHTHTHTTPPYVHSPPSVKRGRSKRLSRGVLVSNPKYISLNVHSPPSAKRGGAKRLSGDV